VLSSCVLVGGFAVAAWVSCYDNIHVCKLIVLYTANAYSAEGNMSASGCTRSMAGCSNCTHILWTLNNFHRYKPHSLNQQVTRCHIYLTESNTVDDTVSINTTDYGVRRHTGFVRAVGGGGFDHPGDIAEPRRRPKNQVEGSYVNSPQTPVTPRKLLEFSV